MNKFPTEINAWKSEVARRLVALRGSVNNMFLGLPQIPDPEIGMPFTGPLSPVPFRWPPTDRSGGTPNTAGTGGTLQTMGTTGACADYANTYNIVLSGATGPCAGIYNISGTVSRGGAVGCTWGVGGITLTVIPNSCSVLVGFGGFNGNATFSTGGTGTFFWNTASLTVTRTSGSVGACTTSTLPTQAVITRLI